ncbi:hypothetical protein AJ79_07811 [Helicocarpus griseus UAMH5409]|uniref:Uncharacterized protein n=1 Tax=Helicocarpus griseus UAMH5409 TaxID=1447875 RepID=A0A2B7WR70_9EURO|nr:hypothetical protein AJ79_07811 [Helicocarpus griseus UAMH5409]
MTRLQFTPWRGVVKKILEKAPLGEFPKLSFGYYCIMTFPEKIREDNQYADIYSCHLMKEKPSPFYFSEVRMYDSFNRADYTSATFIVPTRWPTASSDRYRVEWDPELEVYMLVRVNKMPSTQESAKKTFKNAKPPKPVNNVTSTQKSKVQSPKEFKRPQNQNDLEFPGFPKPEAVPALSSNGTSAASDCNTNESSNITTSVGTEESAPTAFTEYSMVQDSASTHETKKTAADDPSSLLKLDTFDWADDANDFAKKLEAVLQGTSTYLG